MSSARLCILALIIVAVFAEEMNMDDMNMTCPRTENDVYNPQELGYECETAETAMFTMCSRNLCECKGGVFDRDTKQCLPSTEAADCDKIAQCVVAYVDCVDAKYLEAGDDENCTSANVVFFHTQSIIDTTIGNVSGSPLSLQSNCENFVCSVGNETGCMIAKEVCSYTDTTDYGNPVPTNEDGSFAVPVTTFTIILKFHADFANLVKDDVGRKKVKTIMTQSLTKKLKFTTVAQLFSYLTGSGTTTWARKQQELEAGTLTVTAKATVPTSDTAGIAQLTANLEALKTDKSTAWFAALALACGCVVPPPTVEFTTTTSNIEGAKPVTAPPASSSSNTAAIAGGVIGGTAVVVGVVGVAAYMNLKKTAAVAPEAAK